jgi:two-component system, OmpR family, alkaline phosphatase synthesis response regulator PhoP
MKKILLIEDDKFLVRLLKYKLEEIGYKIIMLEEGLEAIKIINKEKPDLILLDLILPGINGFDILKNLNYSKKINDIPVIVISQLEMKSDIQEALGLGVSNYLTKSKTTFNNLVKAIKKEII